MRTNKALSNFIFIVFSFIVIVLISPILSIVLGILFALLYRDKANNISKKISSYPLQIGIVLLGLTISLDSLMPIVKNYFIWVSFFVIFSYKLDPSFSSILRRLILFLIVEKLVNVPPSHRSTM